MEMIWRGSRNYEQTSQIFTGVLYNGYNPPKGFCYDQDDPRIFDMMNVQERVDTFVEAACDQANSYKTNHIIMTMGSDFQYKNAYLWYENLDKLIHYVNEVCVEDSVSNIVLKLSAVLVHHVYRIYLN